MASAIILIVFLAGNIGHHIAAFEKLLVMVRNCSKHLALGYTIDWYWWYFVVAE
jgi:hypothetical protein